MKENNKGITLLVLSITIILMIIIASTATYYGFSAYENAKLSKFEAELRIMHAQVELWEQEGKTEIGVSLNDELISRFELENYTDYYRYLSTDKIKDLGIDGITQEFLVLIDFESINEIEGIENEEIEKLLNNRVISVKGLRYKGNPYYTLYQLQQEGLLTSSYSTISQNIVASLRNNETNQVTFYTSVQAAVNAASDSLSTVTLWKDKINEQIVIGQNRKKQNIILDTNGKALFTSKTNTIQILNNNTLTIKGDGIIENKEGANQTIVVREGSYLVANEGLIKGNCSIANHGETTINGGIINSESEAIYNDGELYINSGKIMSETSNSIQSYGGTIVIGNADDGAVSTLSPVIIGNVFGINLYSSDTQFSFYDGIIKGQIAAICNDHNITINIPDGYQIITEKDEAEKEIAYLNPILGCVTLAKESTQDKKEWFDTLREAINKINTDINEEYIITICRDLEETNTNTILAGSNITINTQGYKLSLSEKTITNNGTLTIVGDGTILSSGSYAIENNGTLTVNSGTIESSGSYAIYNENTGIVNMKNGTVRGTSGIYNKESGTINISGGTIIGTNAMAVRVNKGIARITGGIIQGVTYGIALYTPGQATVTGGTIIASDGPGIYVNGSSAILTLGDNDENEIPINSPVIKGKYGVQTNSSGKYYFYDGIIKGTEKAISNAPNDIPTGYKTSTTTTKDDEGYYTTTLVAQ